MARKRHTDSSRQTAVQGVGRYAGFGLTLGLSTALFAWLGNLLDDRLGTAPFLVLLGTFVGFGAGFYSMYRHLVLDTREDTGDES
ncbi:MAG: AtpZ/AtpI family protein [Gemmatimonadota bacterium]